MPASILFDLDGVFYLGDQPISGAADTVAWVEEHGIPHLFVTNTTSSPRMRVHEKLRRFGIDTDPELIFTPPLAARRWLTRRGLGPVALFVPEATRVEFEGIPVLAEDEVSTVAAVVVGDLGSGWDFPTLNRAFRLLMTAPDTALLALGMTRYWRAEEGLRLDVGAFVSALHYASGIEPTVVGKPAASFFEMALQQLGATARETVMVGDDIRGDIAGAQSAGVRGLLVRTGKYRSTDLGQGVEPDGVLDSVADLPRWWARAGAS